MIHCKKRSNKVVHLLTIYEDGTCGREVHIEFIDGTTFSRSAVWMKRSAFPLVRGV